MSVVIVMLLRVEILKAVLVIVKKMLGTFRGPRHRWNREILHKIAEIHSLQVVYFTRGDDAAALNRAVVYVMSNELTNNMKVVHCFENQADISSKLAENLRVIDQIYPKIRIDLVLVKGKFGPELIERLSRRLGVAKNYMFISTPGDSFPHNIAELGGVRLII